MDRLSRSCIPSVKPARRFCAADKRNEVLREIKRDNEKRFCNYMFGSTRLLQIDIKLFGPRQPALRGSERAVHKKLCITGLNVISAKQSRYQRKTS